jgi:formylglycine-generating enzyme required for sulfatase activity
MKRAVLIFFLVIILNITLLSEQFPSLKDVKVNSNIKGFVWVNPGKFQMGSLYSEWLESNKSRPDENQKHDEFLHHVEISHGFWMQKHEVTQKQYRELMGYLPKQMSGKEDDQLPIVDISHEEAAYFCGLLNKMNPDIIINGVKYVYRLPTEAEWEYCCRAGTGVYRAKNITQQAWCKENSERVLKPVMQKKPNEWGIYDMLGNAGEWCYDWYGEYLSRPVVDPVGVTDLLEKSKFLDEKLWPAAKIADIPVDLLPQKVWRGGNCWFEGNSLSYSTRQSSVWISRSFLLGFRIVIAKKISEPENKFK